MEARFFDHNATTPLWPEAKAAWSEAVDAHWLNPSSPYRQGAAVKVRLESARESLAEMFGVSAERVVFNSGATEGNNAVLAHWANSFELDRRIAVGVIEHPSVLEAARQYFPNRVEWLPVNRAGQIELSVLESLLSAKKVVAVSVMAANNETGVCQQWEAVAELCAQVGVPYHCDASQWIGKLPLDGLSQCAYVTGCAHKFGGPRGTGFLILPESGSEEFCGLFGGEQESGHRGGTEDVGGVLAMVQALAVADAKLAKVDAQLREQFISDLKGAIQGIKLVGGESIRLWNTVSVVMPEFSSARWIAGLERRGFLVSAGSACSTGKSGPSHVLEAMGLSAVARGSVLRISSGWDTTEADWKALSGACVEVYQILKTEVASQKSQVISID